MRAGNLVHDNLYAVHQAHLQVGYTYLSEYSTFYRLSEDVLIVPVVVISWISSAPAAGSPASQDQRWEMQASFDFIPFNGSRLKTYPDDYQTQGWRQPEAPYWPPDDIFTQCDVQFQVVHVFKFGWKSGWNSPCSTDGQTREFSPLSYRNGLLDQALGPNESAYLRNHLQPMFVEVGWWPCSGFSGKGSEPPRLVQVEKGHAGVNLAHEIGHAFGLPHTTLSGNLMLSGAQTTTQLTASQCTAIRQKALPYSDRFRAYNQVLGRTKQQNPLIPSVPKAHEEDPLTAVTGNEICCDLGGSRYFSQLHSCIVAGGISGPFRIARSAA